MTAYLASRLARAALTIAVIVTAVFLATRVTGNPIDFLMPEGLDAESRTLMIAYFGLDRPVWEQYALFWSALFDGEFGIGLLERRPVVDIFAERVGRSLALILAVLAMMVVVGVPVGVFVAVRRSSPVGSVVLLAAFIGFAVPNFVLGILLLLLFSYTLHWLPSAGSATPLHYVMPMMALSAYFVASIVRYTRNAMLEVLSQDYVRTARAKGLSERAVILKHALRNALIPIVTVVGLQVTTLISGLVVIETVFAWHGVCDMLVGATLRRDYPVLQFGVLVISAVVVAVNLAVDVAYAAIDPRVGLARGAR